MASRVSPFRGGLCPPSQSPMIIEGAGHNDLSIIGGEGYIDSLADFIRGSVHSGE